jgi:phospholipid transport system substrate-binding protein
MMREEENFMTNLRTVFWKIMGVSVLLLSHNTWAVADSPTDMIRSTVEQARAVLDDPAYQGNDHCQQRLEKVKAVVLPQFDSQEIARRTLGPYWKDITDEQRKEFIQLFIALVEKAYSSSLDRYSKGVQFFFDQERIDNDFAEVDTRILDPTQNQTFSINYRLRQVNGQWLIYDVVVENVSLVNNYRNQFNRILSKSSYEDLVQKLQTKLQQLDTAPPSGS